MAVETETTDSAGASIGLDVTVNVINQQVVINKDISFAEANFDVSGIAN